MPLPADGRTRLFLWSCAALILILTAAGDVPRVALRWDRDALIAGEAWRLVSGHLIHLDLLHALLNLLAGALLATLFGKELRAAQALLVGVVACGAIDAGLWWLSDVDWYVGLSGVLHAYAAAAIVHRLLRQPEPIAAGLAAFGIGKLIWENTLGALPLAGAATTVVTDAHLYGVLAGTLTGWLLYRVNDGA